MRPVWAAVVALLATIALTNVAYTMLIPLVPELTGRFGLTSVGLAVAFGGYALARALFQPVGGVLVDRVPRPSLLAFAGLCATAAATLGVAVAAAGWQVLVWRLAWGIGEGLTMPALYRLASGLGTGSSLGVTRVMGWFGSSAVAGMAAGPVLVGLLYPLLGFRGVFLAGSALTAASGAVLLLVPRAMTGAGPDAAPPAEPAAAAPTVPGSLAAIAGLVGLFAAIDLVNNSVYSALEPVAPLYLERLTGAGAVSATATLFGAGLAVFAVVSATCARIIESRPLLLVSAAAFAVAGAGLVLAGLSSGVVLFGAGFLIFMATQPVLYVVARRGMSLVPPERLGRAYGGFLLLSDVGFISGPALGLFFYSRLGRGAFVVLAGIAIVFGIGALLMRRLPDRLTAQPTTPARPAPHA